MSGLDNANPTILSASELPTRQVKVAPRLGPESRYNDLIFAKPSFLSRPFCDEGVAWSRGDDFQDDFAAEAIDEQEIYGKIHLLTRASISMEGYLKVYDCIGPDLTNSLSQHCCCTTMQLMSTPRVGVRKEHGKASIEMCA